MNRRHLIGLLGGSAVAWPIRAWAQQPGIPRIGVLMGSTPSFEAARLETFREALKQLGYIDGQTILIEPRYAEGQPDRLGMLAREMVALTPAICRSTWIGRCRSRIIRKGSQGLWTACGSPPYISKRSTPKVPLMLRPDYHFEKASVSLRRPEVGGAFVFPRAAPRSCTSAAVGQTAAAVR